MIIKYGRTPLPLLYGAAEFNQIVLDIINETETNAITYKTICSQVIHRALVDDKFNKEKNTQYSEIILCDSDCHSITKILWDLIWDKKIMIEFHAPLNFCESNDTMFYILK